MGRELQRALFRPVAPGVKKTTRLGNPDMARSQQATSSQNLTIRMGMRRFTRLTNALGKRVENLAHAVSLHLLYYNFSRPHSALKERYQSGCLARAFLIRSRVPEARSRGPAATKTSRSKLTHYPSTHDNGGYVNLSKGATHCGSPSTTKRFTWADGVFWVRRRRWRIRGPRLSLACRGFPVPACSDPGRRRTACLRNRGAGLRR